MAPEGGIYLSTYLPLIIGGVIGAVGSFVFVVRSHALSEEVQGKLETRKLAIKCALAVYVVIACIYLVTSLIVGDAGFIVTSLGLVVAASIGMVVLWPMSPSQ